MSTPSTPINLGSIRESIGLVLETVPEIKRVYRYRPSSDFNVNMPFAWIDLDTMTYADLDLPYGPIGATDCDLNFIIYIIGQLNPAGDNEVDYRLSDTISGKLRPAFEAYPLLEIDGTALAVTTSLVDVTAGTLSDPIADAAWAIQATYKALVTT